jgi:hypothetical protein
MFLLNTQVVTKAFGDYVVQQSRTNLTKKGKNVSKGLYNSIKNEVVSDPDNNYTIISFLMDDYGQFVDQGVKGKSSSAKAPNSPFKFGSGTGKKGGLSKGIRDWVKAKRFQFKDRKSGRFLSYESTAFLISRSIYQKGIKPSEFFSRPLELGLKKYIDTDLMKAFSQDVDLMIEYNLNKN